MTDVSDMIAVMFYEKMEEAWKDAPSDVRQTARAALEETLNSVAGKRVFGQLNDYGNQVGFFVVDISDRLFSVSVRRDDAIALAEVLNKILEIGK